VRVLLFGAGRNYVEGGAGQIAIGVRDAALKFHSSYISGISLLIFPHTF
jgi:hypothetical protein